MFVKTSSKVHLKTEVMCYSKVLHDPMNHICRLLHLNKNWEVQKFSNLATFSCFKALSCQQGSLKFVIIQKSSHAFQNCVFYIPVNFYFSQKGSFLFAIASITLKEKKEELRAWILTRVIKLLEKGKRKNHFSASLFKLPI